MGVSGRGSAGSRGRRNRCPSCAASVRWTCGHIRAVLGPAVELAGELLAVTHFGAELGGQYHLVAQVAAGNVAAQHFLTLTTRIHVGGIYEIAARVLISIEYAFGNIVARAPATVPNVMVPSASGLTTRPERPKVRKSMRTLEKRAAAGAEVLRTNPKGPGPGPGRAYTNRYCRNINRSCRDAYSRRVAKRFRENGTAPIIQRRNANGRLYSRMLSNNATSAAFTGSCRRSKLICRLRMARRTMSRCEQGSKKIGFDVMLSCAT